MRETNGVIARRHGITGNNNNTARTWVGMDAGEGRVENTVEKGDNGRVRAFRTTGRAGWDPGPMWRGCLQGELTVGSG